MVIGNRDLLKVFLFRWAFLVRYAKIALPAPSSALIGGTLEQKFATFRISYLLREYLATSDLAREEFRISGNPK